MSDNISQEVKWNMAGALSLELARLREQANKSFVNRNIASACESLMAMRQTATHVFSEQEILSLSNIEKKLLEGISKILKRVNGFGVEEQSKEKSDSFVKLYMEYLKYNETLQKLLDKYGFLGERKADASKIKF